MDLAYHFHLDATPPKCKRSISGEEPSHDRSEWRIPYWALHERCQGQFFDWDHHEGLDDMLRGFEDQNFPHSSMMGINLDIQDTC
jgi:hypothetical protein